MQLTTPNKAIKMHIRYEIKNSLNICGFPAPRTRSGGDKSTVAPVFFGSMGMQKPSLQENERATATAKTNSSATARFGNIYGNGCYNATGSSRVFAYGVCRRSAEQVLQMRGRKAAATRSTG